MTIDLEPEVVTLLRQGRKIEAIKRIREIRSIGLKESKELVDLYCKEHNFPNPSVERSRSGNGFLILILLGILGYFVYNQQG